MDYDNFFEKFNIWNDTTLGDDSDNGDGIQHHSPTGGVPTLKRWKGLPDEEGLQADYEGYVIPGGNGRPESFKLTKVNGMTPPEDMDMADAEKSLVATKRFEKKQKGIHQTAAELAKSAADSAAKRMQNSLKNVGKTKDAISGRKSHSKNDISRTLDAIKSRGGIKIERNPATDEITVVGNDPQDLDDTDTPARDQVGELKMWPVDGDLPWGWMLADGRTVSPDDYPELALAWGKTTSFDIPDIQGRYVCGMNVVDSQLDHTGHGCNTDSWTGDNCHGGATNTHENHVLADTTISGFTLAPCTHCHGVDLSCHCNHFHYIVVPLTHDEYDIGYASGEMSCAIHDTYADNGNPLPDPPNIFTCCHNVEINIVGNTAEDTHTHELTGGTACVSGTFSHSTTDNRPNTFVIQYAIYVGRAVL